jgi:hypothetical protein
MWGHVSRVVPLAPSTLREAFLALRRQNCSARLDMAACALCEPGEAADLVGL